MPYKIDWYIKDEVIFSEYSGVITADEVRGAMAAVNSLTENSPRSLVHVLIDVGNVTQSLDPKQGITTLRETPPHPRSGWSIIMREHSIFAKMLIMFGASIFKARTRSFDTLEEAIRFLKEMDSTINWEQADHSLVANL